MIAVSSTVLHVTVKETLMADCIFFVLHFVRLCTELSTTFSAVKKKLVLVRYLYGMEPGGRSRDNTIKKGDQKGN